MYQCILCSICKQNFIGADNVDENISALKCSHVFHKSCLDERMKKSNFTCPKCKANFNDGSVFKLNFCFDPLPINTSKNRDGNGFGPVVFSYSDSNSGHGIEVVEEETEIIEILPTPKSMPYIPRSRTVNGDVEVIDLVKGMEVIDLANIRDVDGVGRFCLPRRNNPSPRVHLNEKMHDSQRRYGRCTQGEEILGRIIFD